MWSGYVTTAPNESYKELGFREASEMRREMERDASDLFGGR